MKNSIKRLLRRVKPAGIVTLLVSLVVAEAVGGAIAYWRHKSPSDGASVGEAVWCVVFTIWALLLTLRA